MSNQPATSNTLAQLRFDILDERGKVEQGDVHHLSLWFQGAAAACASRTEPWANAIHLAAAAFMKIDALASAPPAEKTCADCSAIDSTQAADPCVDRLVALIRTSGERGGCSNCGGLPHSTTCRVGRLLAAFMPPDEQARRYKFSATTVHHAMSGSAGEPAHMVIVSQPDGTWKRLTEVEALRIEEGGVEFVRAEVVRSRLPAERESGYMCRCGHGLLWHETGEPCAAALCACQAFEPAADPEDLDPETHCTRHGKPLLPSPYVGVLSSGCEDCEPGDPDGEAARGGEAAAQLRDRQAAARRLK